MAEGQLGVYPARSSMIIECTLRTLSTRSAFDGVLDPSLQALVRSLIGPMPDRLFPDTYLMQTLAGNAPAYAAFALDAHERNYLQHQSQGTFLPSIGVDARVCPEDRDVVCGMMATRDGERAFVVVDDSAETRSLEDATQRASVSEALGCTEDGANTVGRLLERIAPLPLRYLVRQFEGERELLILLPRTTPRQRFEDSSYKEALFDALAALGIDNHSLEGLAHACVRVGVPCDTRGNEGHRWVAHVDVACFSLVFSAGALVRGMAGIRVSDRTIPFLHMAIRPSRAYQWHITENCDQRCKHCYLFAEDARAHCATMPLDDLLRTLDRIEERCASFHVVPILNVTGGDPVLHPQFWEFAEELHRRGFLWTIMGNPFHLTDEVCQRLRALGCVRYQLSLDGRRAFHDSLRKPGSFDATIAAARTLKQAGMCVQFMATVSKQNLGEITHCMDIADSLGVDCFTFARYCATSPEKATELYPTPEEYRKLLLDFYQRRQVFAREGSQCEFRCKDHLFILLAHELGDFEVPVWSRERPDVVCGGCHLAKKATIAANGNLLACPRTGLIVGNVHEDDLAAVEDGEAMRAFRDVRRIEGCKDCGFLMWCRGCRAVGYGVTHDAWSADPMCWRRRREPDA